MVILPSCSSHSLRCGRNTPVNSSRRSRVREIGGALRGRLEILGILHALLLFSLLLNKDVPPLEQVKIRLSVEIVHRHNRLTSDLSSASWTKQDSQGSAVASSAAPARSPVLRSIDGIGRSQPASALPDEVEEV
jgi:hypothetical protein